MKQAVQGRARRCARRPKKWTAKTQRTDANVGRVRTLVRSDKKLGVRVIAEELNMNRETVRQIVKKDLGVRKYSLKNGASNLDTWPVTTSASHFI